MVYISNRFELLNDSLRQVNLFMSFITEVVVIGPLSIKSKIVDFPNFDFRFIDENELFDFSIWKDKEHAVRNFQLRVALLKSTIVNDEFIMSDDDYRPIVPTDLSTFKQEGKYRNYFYCDLNEFHSRRNSFDRGQLNALKIMKRIGAPELAYASHMPQIINKRLFLEGLELMKKGESNQALCEWAIYFNLARKMAPEKFCKPEPFISLCWPDYPGIWKNFVTPGSYKFENYYPHLYNRNDLFENETPLPDLENYQEVLDRKVAKIANLKSSGNMPRMTYRGTFFNFCYPVLNWVYKLLYKA